MLQVPGGSVSPACMPKVGIHKEVVNFAKRPAALHPKDNANARIVKVNNALQSVTILNEQLLNQRCFAYNSPFCKFCFVVLHTGALDSD